MSTQWDDWDRCGRFLHEAETIGRGQPRPISSSHKDNYGLEVSKQLALRREKVTYATKVTNASIVDVMVEGQVNAEWTTTSEVYKQHIFAVHNYIRCV